MSASWSQILILRTPQCSVHRLDYKNDIHVLSLMILSVTKGISASNS